MWLILDINLDIYQSPYLRAKIAGFRFPNQREDNSVARYRCTVCNWVYDEKVEGKKFGSLPHAFTCPVCGAPKSAFVPEGVSKGDESIETTVAE
ncbi:MAG: rubredoxin, partial [Candidatus Thorarchaeota archaeon]